eukprot:283325_1
MNKFLNYLESVNTWHHYPTATKLVILYMVHRSTRVQPGTIAGDLCALNYFNKLNGYFTEISKIPVVHDLMNRIRKIYDPQTNDTRLPFLWHHLVSICTYFNITTNTMMDCDLQTLAHCTILLISCMIGNRQFELCPRIQSPAVYEHGLRLCDIEIIEYFRSGHPLPPFLVHSVITVRDKNHRFINATKRHVIGKTGSPFCPAKFLWAYCLRRRQLDCNSPYVFLTNQLKPITVNLQSKFLK